MDRFADRLNHARLLRGLSQTEIARRLGVTQQAVSKWIDAETLPSPARIEALARVLDVPPEWLSFGRGQAPDALAEDLAAARFKAARAVPMAEFSPRDVAGELRYSCLASIEASARLAEANRQSRAARMAVLRVMFDLIVEGASRHGWEALPIGDRDDLVLLRGDEQARVDVFSSVLHVPVHGGGLLPALLRTPPARELGADLWLAWPILIEETAHVLVVPSAMVREHALTLAWHAGVPFLGRSDGEGLDVALFLDRFEFATAPF